MEDRRKVKGHKKISSNPGAELRSTKAHWSSVTSVLYRFRVWQVAFCSDMIFSPRVIMLNSL